MKSIIIILFLLVSFQASAEQAHNPNVQRPINDFKGKYLDLCATGDTISSEKTAVKLDPKAEAAHQVLSARCTECHAKTSTKGAKSFSDILDSGELLSKSIIKSADPTHSLLISRIQDGTMPPSGERLSDVDKKVLIDWIQDGAKPLVPPSNIPDVGRITQEDLEACLLKDLRALPEADRPFVRYLDLSHLYNGDKKSELESNRLAMNKLFNSLSWKKEIKNAVSVDKTGTLLRFDLRDYKWTPQAWEQLAALEPYGIPSDTPKVKEIAEKTTTQKPLLRGDWVVFSLSRPPLYHSFLYDLQKLPISVSISGAQQSLESLLFVDRNANMASGDVVSAGFGKSNVTKSNRIIRRHDTPYGGYWLSEDFNGRNNQQNIFEHPLDGSRAGGEYIFSLPNGLHGYLVTDNLGNRLDGAPTDVVVDPLRLDTDGVVIPGASCMSCHTKGIKKRNDEILTYFTDLERLSKGKNPPQELETQINDVKRVYKDNSVLSAKYDLDETAYANAITKTGNSIEEPDPVYTVTSRFERALNLVGMAAELGCEPTQLEEALDLDLTLRRSIGYSRGSTIERPTFNEKFKIIKEAVAKVPKR